MQDIKNIHIEISPTMTGDLRDGVIEVFERELRDLGFDIEDVAYAQFRTGEYDDYPEALKAQDRAVGTVLDFLMEREFPAELLDSVEVYVDYEREEINK